MKPFAVMPLSGLLLAVWTFPAQAVTPPPANPSVAVVSKAIADVTRKQGKKEWSQAKIGEPLVSGDRLRTGQRSIAIIKFKDIYEHLEIATDNCEDVANTLSDIAIRHS